MCHGKLEENTARFSNNVNLAVRQEKEDKYVTAN